MDEAGARTLFEFVKSFMPAHGVAAVHDVALALVGRPSDKIDEGIETMTRMMVENFAAQPEPRPEVFVSGLVVVCREMIRKSVIYWYSLFSHQRTTFAWKGFAALALDPVGDQAALTVLGSI